MVDDRPVEYCSWLKTIAHAMVTDGNSTNYTFIPSTALNNTEKVITYCACATVKDQSLPSGFNRGTLGPLP